MRESRMFNSGSPNVLTLCVSILLSCASVAGDVAIAFGDWPDTDNSRKPEMRPNILDVSDFEVSQKSGRVAPLRVQHAHSDAAGPVVNIASSVLPRSDGKKMVAFEAARLREAEFEVNSLAWSPDGRYLAASGTLTNKIHIWSVAETRTVQVLDGGIPGPFFDTLAYSPDGQYLAGCQSRNEAIARIWSIATGAVIKDILRFGPGLCSYLAFHPKGDVLAVAMVSPGVEFPSVGFFVSGDWTLKESVNTPKIFVRKVAFSPDGQFLAIGGYRNTETFPEGIIQLWDLSNHSQAKTVIAYSNTEVESLAFAQNGKVLAAGSRTGKGMSMLEGRTGARIQEDNQEAIKTWDVETGTLATIMTSAIQPGHLVRALKYSSKYLFSGHDDKVVRIWDGVSHSLVQEVQMLGPVMCLAADVQARKIAVGTGRLITVFDLVAE